MSRPGDRAASEVVGAVLIFGILVISFSIYQGIVVPNQNRGIEFDHNQAVQDSVQDLRNAIRQTSTTGAEESVSITLGATYPQRVIAVNPGASAGAIGTSSLGTITLHNITAEDSETRDYFGKNTTTLGAFESKTLVYHPVYFQYRQAPNTRYENTLAYNEFPGGVNLSITDQAVIKDNRITLVALNGSFSAARQGTVTIDTTALSTATNTVTVTNDTGPINITFGTQLTAANWTEQLEDEMTPNGHVTDVIQSGPNQVSIILEPGVTYELRLAKVGVGSDTTAVAPKYIVDADGDNTSVAENGTQKLVAEVRDPFNNPVSNVTVTAASPGQGSLDRLTATTDSDGQATFIYTAPSDIDGATDVEIDMSFDGDGTLNESVTFTVRVLDSDASGSDSGGISQVNPSGEDKLVLESSTRVTGQSQSADLTFNNTASSDFVVTSIRVPFYLDDGSTRAVEVESFAGVETFEGAGTLPIGAPLTDLGSTVTFNADSTSTIRVTFVPNTVNTNGDFFILVMKLDSGATLTYFVAP